MKFHNVMRTGLAIVGLGAALSLAGAARAQEIVNTEFPDGSGVAPFCQPAAATENTATSNSLTTPTVATSQAAATAAVSGAGDNDSGDYERTSAAFVWIGACFVWIGAIGVYLGGPAKRLTQELRALRNAYNPSRSA